MCFYTAACVLGQLSTYDNRHLRIDIMHDVELRTLTPSLLDTWLVYAVHGNAWPMLLSLCDTVEFSNFQ